MNKPTPRIKKISIRAFSKIDYTKLMDELNVNDLTNNIDVTEGANEAFNVIQDELTELIDKHAPKSVKT